MGRRFCIITFAVALVSLTVSFAEGRDRGRTIRCESTREKYAYCPTETTGRVELARQLSKAPCEEYDTWGADDDGSGIWVRGGCRAEFVVRERRGWGRWRDRQDDRDESRWRRDRDEISRIRCASKDWGYEHCEVRGGGRDARIVRQISDTRCVRGHNWDRDRRGIWVDRGCEAEFEVR